MPDINRQFVGCVDLDGRMQFASPTAVRTHLRTLAGRDVEVVIRPQRTQRSLKQNAWVWGVAYELLADAFGYDRHEHDDLHYALVEKCFGTKWDARLRAMVPTQRSSKLTVKQFSDYMEWLVRFGVEHGVAIPLPDDVDTDVVRSGPDGYSGPERN